jgi:DNA-binding phage protein
MLEEGCSSQEIADRVGMTRQGVCRMLKRADIPIGRRGATRRVGAFIPHRTFGVIAEIAKEAGVSRSTMIKRIVEAVCSSPTDARRFLGKLAR